MRTVAGPFLVPATLDWLNSSDSGRRWLVDLPGLTGEALARFDVRQDGPLLAGMVSLVVPAVTAAGRPVVVKVRWPHPEAAHEVAALRAWAGTGAAVELLDEAPDLDALLLERLDPGTPISMLAPAAADRVVADLVDRAAVPAPPGAFRSLADWADDWVDDLTGRAAALRMAGGPDDASAAARLADRAALVAARLAGTQPGPPIVANEDLHYARWLCDPLRMQGLTATRWGCWSGSVRSSRSVTTGRAAGRVSPGRASRSCDRRCRRRAGNGARGRG